MWLMTSLSVPAESVAEPANVTTKTAALVTMTRAAFLSIYRSPCSFDKQLLYWRNETDVCYGRLEGLD